MMRQGKILLAAGLFAVSSTACFTDPTESLRGGADRLELQWTAITLSAGDSGFVDILVRDKQGNQLPVTNVSLTTANAAIVTVGVASVIAPGNLFARGALAALPTAAGPTTVTVSANGLSATLGVLVLPTIFPGTVSNGAGNLLDDIVINSGAVASFVTSGANATTASLGNDSLWIVSRTATQLRGRARAAGSGTITVNNVVVAGVIVPSLTTTGSINVAASAAGDPNEPANDAPGGVTIPVEGSTATNPVVVFGTIADAGDTDDLFTFTTTAPGPLVGRLEFFGTGGGGSTNPDVDFYVCNAACTAFVNTQGGTAVQPENFSISSLAAGTYNIYVLGYDTGGATVPYKLIIRQ